MCSEQFVRLEKEPIVYRFDVKPLSFYTLSFFIFSKEDESRHDACLMSFNFDNTELTEKSSSINRLSLSPSVGYFNYIEVSKTGGVVQKRLFVPNGVEYLEIKFLSWKNQSDILMSKDVSLKEIPVKNMINRKIELLQSDNERIFQRDMTYFHALYNHKEHNILENTVVALERKYHTKLPALYEQICLFYMERSYQKAYNYAMRSLTLEPDNLFLRKKLYTLHMRFGYVKRAFSILPPNIVLPVVKPKKENLEKMARRLPENTLQKAIDILLKSYPEDKTKLLRLSFVILKDIYPELAIMYGKGYIYLQPDDHRFARVLVRRMQRVKYDDDVIKIIKMVTAHVEDDELQQIKFQYDIRKEMESCELLYYLGEEKKVDALIKTLEKKYHTNLSALYKIFFRFYRDKSYEKACIYITHLLSHRDDESLLRELYDLHLRYGHIRKALSVLPHNYVSEAIGIKHRTGGALLELFEKGAKINLPDISNHYRGERKKVFYLLHNRLPYNSGGYATRTHGLLTNIARQGWDIHGVSRLGYPDDKIADADSKEFDVVDGIVYHRLKKEGTGLGKMPMTDYLQAYAEELLAFALEEKPAFIHAASNHMNGLVGNAVARALGIPSVYEVRGLWEITRISREPAWKDTDYFNLMVRLEAQAAKEADVVLTLTEALKEEMVSRGVPEEKIHIVPNGVTVERFLPRARDEILQKRLGLEEKCVIGYIGSVVAYEGLELLVDAVEILSSKELKPFAVLVVGDGAVLEEVQERVVQKELEPYFIFTGRVPHEEVESYYSLVDIAPFPRRAQPVCEMVSPLKPFEAMAMEKAVLSSNVAALAEIVKDGYNGLLFEKESVEDLAEKLALLIEDEVLRTTLGTEAKKWVEKERDWQGIAQKVSQVYSMLSDRMERIG